MALKTSLLPLQNIFKIKFQFLCRTTYFLISNFLFTRKILKKIHDGSRKKQTIIFFHYFPNSLAEKEIATIVERQEKAFDKIISFLKVESPERKINYYLYPDARIKKNLWAMIGMSSRFIKIFAFIFFIQKK